jgi:hypothetical protein
VNALAERGVRSVQSELLSKLLLFGERSLWHALNQDMSHSHHERPHQGIGHVIPFLAGQSANDDESSPIQCHERLGGLLQDSHRKAT